MSEYITPKVDIAFKKIFGVEENKDLLLSLINSIVSVEDRAASIEIMNPYNTQEFKRDKLSILDIKARRGDGVKYNIEIQVSDEGDYDKRALYYWSKTYAEQMEKGLDYTELNKTIGIHILNFLSIPKSNKYHNVFTIQEKYEKLPHFVDFEIHTIELSKFEGKKEPLELILKKIQEPLDEWVTFMTKHEDMSTESLPEELHMPEIRKAMHILDVMNFNNEEREEYEARLKWLRVEASTVKKVYEDGKKEGFSSGKIERSKEIAIQMLSQGMDTQLISQITGLPLEVIVKLQ